ncbi:MAG: nucleotidyltransferase domain-containing protein [Archaeoglobaceae archaeon]
MFETSLDLKKAKEYFENFIYYAEKIKKAAIEVLGNAEVFVFGSVVKGKATMASDIDLMIVSNQCPRLITERAKKIVEILKKAEIDLFAPFEIHLINEREFEWYRKFIKKLLKV